MKKFLLTLTLIFSNLVIVNAQDPIQYLLKNYFRIHPFDRRFSTFINQLRQDPLFSLETFETRTDTSFFYLSGTYKNFNPFHFTPSEVRLVLAEVQYVHADSLQTLDTIINFQIMGISGMDATSLSNVNKEFKRVKNKITDRFAGNTYDHIENHGVVTAEVYNYFLSQFSVSPVSIAWGPINETNQSTFTITIRFKIKENMAQLILAPGEEIIFIGSYEIP